ncbi:amidohydrolase family protein [Aureimonas altamirensis]|uniref:amidohydrolase family protein n=1 Tax=Aureimonas altamirensis TaxID=370622 RepID=UPI001E368FE5|nr:amidohydrolase family protein [Aureimonas altamirensis]UHD45928.1 amidohydrolase family protein [Aureimonas altamirensis]
MRIDAHQHFWAIADRGGQWPPPDLAAIHRDFSPADLKPLLASSGIDGTVLVQSLPSLADTRFLLGIADREPFVLGVVGWVDMKAPDAAITIAEIARHPKLKGLRPMLQDLPDVDWIDDPALDASVAAMLAANLVFDALVKPEHLAPLAHFARRHPDLSIVIDHCAKPDIASGDLADWRRGMDSLAAMPQVSCKLSGIVTEAGSPPDMDGVGRVAGLVLQAFGPDRVIFGSDWPVIELAGQYADWTERVEAAVLSNFGRSAIDDVLGENARRFYSL